MHRTSLFVSLSWQGGSCHPKVFSFLTNQGSTLIFPGQAIKRDHSANGLHLTIENKRILGDILEISDTGRVPGTYDSPPFPFFPTDSIRAEYEGFSC